MPKIPTYQFSVGVPRGGIGVMDTINLSTPYAHAVSGVGNMLQARGAQLLEEYDATRAYSAFNQLRDEARGKISELYEREGAAAQGIQKEYEDWERQTRNKIGKDGLTAFSQQSLFDKLADQHRASDLNSLAAHEAQQHKVFKRQTIDGLSRVVEGEIRTTAFDDQASDSMINDWFGAVDRLYPGQNKTADKLAGLQVFRVAQMQELIDKNPKYAAEKLEAFKSDLGDKYYALKKQLEGAVAEDKMSGAYEQMHTRFGNNYEAAMSWLAIPGNQKELGLDFKEVNQLHSRFSGLLADRERAVNLGETRLRRLQDINDARALQSKFDPNAPKVDIHDLHRRRQISDATYKYLNEAKESSATDNPWVVTELYDRIERGEDVTKFVMDAVDNGGLSEKTAATLGKHQVDERSKRAVAQIARFIKPSDFDWSQDKKIKYGEAIQLYQAKLASGKSYEQASLEVIEDYLDGLKRNAKNIPTPDGITAVQKTDMASLEQAKKILVQQRNIISPEEYRVRMEHIDRLMQLAVDSQSEEQNADLLEALRKQGKIQK